MADRLVIRKDWLLILSIVWLTMFNLAVVAHTASETTYESSDYSSSEGGY